MQLHELVLLMNGGTVSVKPEEALVRIQGAQDNARLLQRTLAGIVAESVMGMI